MPFEAKPIEWEPAEDKGKYEGSNIWKWGYVDTGAEFGKQLVRINLKTQMPYVSDLRRFGLVDKQDIGKASSAKHNAARGYGPKTPDDSVVAKDSVEWHGWSGSAASSSASNWWDSTSTSKWWASSSWDSDAWGSGDRQHWMLQEEEWRRDWKEESESKKAKTVVWDIVDDELTDIDLLASAAAAERDAELVRRRALPAPKPPLPPVSVHSKPHDSVAEDYDNKIERLTKEIEIVEKQKKLRLLREMLKAAATDLGPHPPAQAPPTSRAEAAATDIASVPKQQSWAEAAASVPKPPNMPPPAELRMMHAMQRLIEGADDVAAWIRTRCPSLSAETQANVCKVFKQGNFDPRVFIERCDEVSVPKGNEIVKYYRLATIDDLQTKFDDNPDHWEYQGFHCTSTLSMCRALKDRGPRNINFAGLYCLLVQQPKTLEDMKPLCAKVTDGKRDFARALIEIKTKGESRRLQSGGIEADEEYVKRNIIVHMKTSSEDRWCVPPSLICFKALWLREGSFEDFELVDHDIPL